MDESCPEQLSIRYLISQSFEANSKQINELDSIDAY